MKASFIRYQPKQWTRHKSARWCHHDIHIYLTHTWKTHQIKQEVGFTSSFWTFWPTSCFFKQCCFWCGGVFFSTFWIKKQHNKWTTRWLIITNLSSKGLSPHCPLVILCLLSPFLHHSPTSPRTSHLNSHLPTTSPHLSSSLTHFELLSHFSSSPLKHHFLLPLSPPSPPPLFSIFPSPPSPL